MLCSYNDIVRGLDSEIVIFLNNDMKADECFVDPLSELFEQKDLMFAAPRIMNPDNTFNGGKSSLKFRFGAVRVEVDHAGYMERGRTQAISTGAFRRKMFLELGGFDDLYLPGIWEDVDICYRGQLRGWGGIYEPKSLIWHEESTTFHREFGRKRKMRLAHRNMFLFIWKNIKDPQMLAQHVILAVPRALALFVKGQTEVIEGLILALGKIKTVLKKRAILKKEACEVLFKDREFFK